MAVLFILSLLGEVTLVKELTAALQDVPNWVWGVSLSFIGSIYTASDNTQLSVGEKLRSGIFGTAFGFAFGYGFQYGLGVGSWSYIVYLICGVFGIYLAGGTKTIGERFKKRPLKTAQELSDLRKRLLLGNDEQDDDDNTKRGNGPASTDGK